MHPPVLKNIFLMEVENMVHSDSMSPASLGIWTKLSRRWELSLIEIYEESMRKNISSDIKMFENIIINHQNSTFQHH